MDVPFRPGRLAPPAVPATFPGLTGTEAGNPGGEPNAVNSGSSSSEQLDEYLLVVTSR